MLLRHIIAATDESEAGRWAARTAVDLASGSARVTLLRVAALHPTRLLAGVAQGPDSDGHGKGAELGRLRQWVVPDVLPENEATGVRFDVTSGIPAIEICRFAEQSGADLVVLGRKRRSQGTRLLLGDTADAVARRSRLPCLFVPMETVKPRGILVALDGTERGMNVLDQACGFAAHVGARVEVVTVERGPADEPWNLASTLPVAKSSKLQDAVRGMLARNGLPDSPLMIRRGDVTETILSAILETECEVLVIGYHRGGPAGFIEAGSTARRLTHAAPCAVLTIPL